jgi:hypothetical protein
MVPTKTHNLTEPSEIELMFSLCPRIFGFIRCFIESFLTPVRGKLRQNGRGYTNALARTGFSVQGIYAGRVGGN